MGMFSWTINRVERDSQDVFCFLTSEGQLFIYSGNPDDITTIFYIGTYDIGRPVSRRCWVKFGADVLIFTETGIEAVSQIFGQGQTIQDSYEFQKYINPLIKQKMDYYIAQRPVTPDITKYNSIHFDSINEFIILTFSEKDQILINIKNRSGTELKGLDMRCCIVAFGKFLYGDNNGNILQAYDGDADYNIDNEESNLPIRAEVVTGFSNFDSPNKNKICTNLLLRLRAADIPTMGVNGIIDYDFSQSLPVVRGSKFDVHILGVNFRLGTSYLVEPKGLSDFSRSGVDLKGNSLGIQMVCERFGYEVSWVSCNIRYKESEKEVIG